MDYGQHTKRLVETWLLLSDGSSAVVKWHAMRALARFAERKHVSAITMRVRTILGSKRVIPQTEPPFIAPDVGNILFLTTEGADAKKTELLLAFEALTRLSALVGGELSALLRKHWAELTDAERTYLKGQDDEFGELDG